MAVIEVKKIKQLKQFIDFPNKLYKRDSNYIIQNDKAIYYKIKNQVLKEKSIKCIMYEKNNVIMGRVAFCYGVFEKEKVCYFSYLDFTNSEKIANELFEYIFQDMQVNEVSNLIGPYENDLFEGKGILVQGFDFPPSIYSGYNYSYYSTILEKIGFNKINDYVDLKINENLIRKKDISNIVLTMTRRYNFDIVQASAEKNKKELLEHIFRESKVNHDEYTKKYLSIVEKQIDYDLVYIAKEKDTNEPMACALAVYDFSNLHLKKSKIVKAYRLRKKQTKSVKIIDLRVMPKYYKTDLGIYLCSKLLESLSEKDIKNISIGKINENDSYNMKIYRKLGAEISHVYRIYSLDINKRNSN